MFAMIEKLGDGARHARALRGRRISPVYLLPNLQEPNWRTLRVGDVNEYWEKLADWEQRVAIAVRTTGRAMFFFSPKNRRLAFFNARLFVRRDALWSGWAGIGLRSRFSIGLSSTIPRISSAVNRRALPSADSDVMPKRRHGWKR